MADEPLPDPPAEVAEGDDEGEDVGAEVGEDVGAVDADGAGWAAGCEAGVQACWVSTRPVAMAPMRSVERRVFTGFLQTWRTSDLSHAVDPTLPVTRIRQTVAQTREA